MVSQLWDGKCRGVDDSFYRRLGQQSLLRSRGRDHPTNCNACAIFSDRRQAISETIPSCVRE